ncbi:MAG: hypothetical protein ACK4GQ_02130 [Candidatus Hadarchaeales archaeon]
MRQRVQAVCPFCGKMFNLELEVETYVSVESTPSKRESLPPPLRGHEAKVDFVRRATVALAAKDPAGQVEFDEIVELAGKVGLTKEEVNQILEEEKTAGRIYEPKPRIFSFTARPEKA